MLSVSREEEDREGLGLGLEQGHEQHHLQQQQQPLGVIACSGGGGSAKELFQAGRHGELAEEHSGRSAESVIALRKATTTSSIAPSIAPSITAGSSASPPAAQVLYFPIPCACVGGIIGRGGRGLRELQAEFGVRVYVEKEEYLGQRIVALSYIGAGVNAGVGAGVGTGVEARRASSPGANSNSYCEELDEGPAGRDGSQCVENHNRECDRREGGSDFPTARARSRSDSLSLGALDRDLQIEDEEGEGEGETERGGEHDLLRGECEVGEGLEGEEELQDKFLPDLALAKPSRGSAAFVSINALLHGGASNCHNARAKTKRPASTSDADSEHTPSSSGGNGGGVSAGGKNRAAVAKYKRNRTDIDCFVSDPAAVAFDAGHGGSPIEQEPFVDCLSQSPTQQKQPHQLSPQRDQGEGAGGGRSKSKRGYASEGEEGCSGGCGERRGKDHRKSLRTATAAGGGGAVMPLNRERERACSVTAIGEVPLQRRGPLLSTTVPSSFSWVSQTLRAPRSVSEARSRLSSSSGDDDDVIDININNRKGTGRSRFTGEQLVDSDDADDRAPSNSTSNSSSKILSRGNNSHNSHQAVQLPKRAEEGAAATVHELSQQQEQQVGSRSKRKRTSGGEEDLPPNSPPTIPSHTSPVTGNSTSCSGQQLELVSVGSASAAHVATTASIPSSDAPSSTRTVEMQVMALQRCKERIEAMIEDILQRQVRDVGNNDL